MSLEPMPDNATLLRLKAEREGKRVNGVELGADSPLRTKRSGGRPPKAELKRPSDGRRKEHDIQVALFRQIDDDANRLKWPELAMVFAVPNGGHRLPAVAAKLRAEGVRAGVLDLWLPVPRGGWTGWVCEMKRPGGTTTPEQAHWMSALAREGWKVALHTNEDAAFADLIAYLELPPTIPTVTFQHQFTPRYDDARKDFNLIGFPLTLYLHLLHEHLNTLTFREVKAEAVAFALSTNRVRIERNLRILVDLDYLIRKPKAHPGEVGMYKLTPERAP